MGWTLADVYALPADVYLECVRFVNEEVNKAH